MDYFFISAQITFGVLSPVILVVSLVTLSNICKAVSDSVKDKFWDKDNKARELHVDNVFEANNPNYLVLLIKDQLDNCYRVSVTKARIKQVVK